MSPRLLFLLSTRHAPKDHRDRIDARIAAARYLAGGILPWDDLAGLPGPRGTRVGDGVKKVGLLGGVRVLAGAVSGTALRG